MKTKYFVVTNDPAQELNKYKLIQYPPGFTVQCRNTRWCSPVNDQLPMITPPHCMMNINHCSAQHGEANPIQNEGKLYYEIFDLLNKLKFQFTINLLHKKGEM